jgi:hypothetical protein
MNDIFLHHMEPIAVLTFLKGCIMDNEEQSSQILKKLVFPKIFQTFRMAIQRSKLMIAFAAVVVICFVGWIMDFSRTVVTDRRGAITELQVYMESPRDAGAVSEFRLVCKETGKRKGVFSTLWHFATERFHGALYSLFAFNMPAVAANIGDWFRAVGWALRYHFVYCIIFGAVKLAVISVAGGAICRISALQFAQGEKPGLTEALRFSIRRFLSFFAAPLVPAGIIIVVGVIVLVIGLIGNIPRVGEIIMGLFMVLALLAGFLIAIILIGAVAGFNLMFPAVVYDGSDCFDAISRAFSYVYSRPWRMAFYTAVAAVYGAICYLFVRFFAFLLLLVTYAALDIGVFSEADGVSKLARIWSKPTFVNLMGSDTGLAMNGSERFAALLVYLLLLVVVGLVVSFLLSFYFSANTIIYSLMRFKVDNTALEDVYMPVEEPRAGPAVADKSADEEAQADSEAEAESSSSGD